MWYFISGVAVAIVAAVLMGWAWLESMWNAGKRLKGEPKNL